ncbi:MAG: NUDIX hydrolase [Melioribacteraceae bacterium]|jgi:ADP-ribose pyrophosphatase|nr:ADP-ribose pyrophosphatase [Ignavibacteriota bacterium]MBZ0180916.1 NUDIX hydrolase [Melioribacteraceae bacterium]
MNYKIIESNIIHKGKVFDLRIDNIVYDSGNKGIREVAIHNGGAVVVPVLDNGNIVLVKQFRYPFEKFLLELPAGKLDLNEDPLVCARRELIEETGYRSSSFVKLGSISTTPGFCTEILHIYLAENLKSGNHDREEGEYGMEVFSYPLEQVKEMISAGDIIDAKTIAGIFYYTNLKQK